MTALWRHLPAVASDLIDNVEKQASADPAAVEPVPAEGAVPYGTGVRSERFTFVDGLRGLAALGVLAFHLSGYFVLAGKIGDYSPLTRIAIAIGRRGHLGVEVFFVISGFVIAHSLRNAPFTWGTVCRFTLRRSIRIDPPYWATLLLIVALNVVRRTLGDGQGVPRMSIPQVLAHFAYLQDILGYRPLLQVLWTLCLEIQFYLVFVLSGFMLRRRPAHAVFMIVTMIVSIVLTYRGTVPTTSTTLMRTPIWFIGPWYLFVVGVWTYWLHAGRIGRMAYLAGLLPIALLAIVRLDASAATGAITAGALAVASMAGTLTTWLRNRVAQFFGRISYSFYLLHLLVSSLVFYQLRPRIGHGEIGMWCIAGIATVLSILAAVVMHRLVEAPSIALARRVAGIRKEIE